MLSVFRWVALAAFVVLMIAIAGLIVSPPPVQPSNEIQKTENQTENAQKKSADTFWDRWFPEPISLYTFVLVLFTAILAFGGLYQLKLLRRAETIATQSANAAKDSADTAKNALIGTQRPFVFVGVFETHVINDAFIIMPQWRNGGNTPALRMRNYVNWKAFEPEPPPNFTWPDLDANGQPLPAKGAGIVTYIGPQATQYADSLSIPIPTMEEARAGAKQIFIWGWAEYDDDLGSGQRHRTEFANKMEITNLGQDVAGKVTVAAGFRIYGPYNSAN